MPNTKLHLSTSNTKGKMSNKNPFKKSKEKRSLHLMYFVPFFLWKLKVQA